MTKTEVIASVADELSETEKAIDEAINRATTLVQAMIVGRTTLNISPVVGAEAQTKVIEAIASLSAARQAMVTSHSEMAKDHRRLGFGVFAEIAEKGQGTRPETVGEHRLRAV